MKLLMLTCWAVVLAVASARPQYYHHPVTDIAAAFQAYNKLWLSEAQRNSVKPTSIHQPRLRASSAKKQPAEPQQEGLEEQQAMKVEEGAEATAAIEQQEEEQLVQEQVVAETPAQVKLVVQEEPQPQPQQIRVRKVQPAQPRLRKVQPAQPRQRTAQPAQPRQRTAQPAQPRQQKAQPAQPRQQKAQPAEQAPEPAQASEQAQLASPKEAEPAPKVLVVEAAPELPPAPDMAAAYNNFFDLWNAEAARNRRLPYYDPFTIPVAAPAVKVAPTPKPEVQPKPTLKVAASPKSQPAATPKATPANTFVTPSISLEGHQDGSVPLIIVLPQRQA